MNLLKFISCSAILFIFNQTNAQDRYLQTNEFPEKIISFVQTHFPEDQIVTIKEEKERRKTEYEVKLNSRAELEFDGGLEIIKIESKSGLPDSVLPKKIVAYVSQNYPGRKIEEWKKKKKYQEIELDNSLELEFDFDGNFMKIDD